MKERMKNWIFMLAEDQIKGLTPEEIFNMPGYEADGQEKKKLSPMEKYYQQLERRNDPRRSRNGEKGDRLSNSSRKDDSEDDSAESQESDKAEKGNGSKQSDQFLKSVFDADKNAFAPLTTPSTFSDIFGGSKTDPSADEVQKQKTHNRELQQLYGNPFSSFSPGIDAPTRSPIESLMPIAGPSFTSPQVAPVPTFNPVTTPDFSAKAFGSATAPLQLKIETPKVTPIAPSFTAPRRPF